MRKQKSVVTAVAATSSYARSETDSVMTTINYKGSSMRINCRPLQLIEFLIIDLKTKLKEFVPEGERASAAAVCATN